jgi:tRNA(Arg) A34 adenosine deaminase TadA
MSIDQDFLQIAIEEAKAAAARGEVPIGAVLVSGENAILARDGNRVVEHHDPGAHAEVLVLRAAALALGNERLVGTTLYATLEPCTMCAGLISLARVARLVYAAEDPKGGAIAHGVRFFDQPTCHHRPAVSRLDDDGVSAKLLTDFFRVRRA